MTVSVGFEFDEDGYLDANPDLREVVERGQFPSGEAHWLNHGRREGRALRTRAAKLREGIDLRATRGLEIGALCRPSIPKSDGDVRYVDFAERSVLAEKYANSEDVDIGLLVDVDVIWGEQSLLDALGPDDQVDWIIASHVVEHVPDPITWLGELESVLAHGGRIRLIVPDGRYTFDYLRAPTTFPELLDAYVQRARVPLPRHILDFFLNSRDIDHVAAWRGQVDESSLTPRHSPASALSVARDSLVNGTYHDCHCSVFTPTTFVELMVRVADAGLLTLECVQLVPTEVFQTEFFVELVACEDQERIRASWTEARHKVLALPDPAVALRASNP